MKTKNLLSLRAAARQLQIDRATLARIVAERRVAPAGRRAGHSVFEYAALRRVVDLEFYGGSAPRTPTCDECWGPLANHRGYLPCEPGSYERHAELASQAAELADAIASGRKGRAIALLKQLANVAKSLPEAV